jgi:hypothetical protein
MAGIQQSDWLDSLARRTVTRSRRVQDHHDSRPPDGEAHYSRAAVARLALAAVVPVLVGGIRVDAAGAQTRDECYQQCVRRYIDAAENELKACHTLFDDPKSLFNTEPGSWQRIKAILNRGLGGWVGDNVNHALEEGCNSRALNRMDRGLDRCDDACRETCPSGYRTTSAYLGPKQTCHGEPPPKPKPPTPPPAPPPPKGPAQSSCGPDCASGVCCDCGWGTGPFCVGYVPDPPCDVCLRNCVGTCS